MKIAIITFDEPFFIPKLFEPLIAKHHKLIKIVIIVPLKHPQKSTLSYLKEQLVLMSLLGFLKLSSRYIFRLMTTHIGLRQYSVFKLAKRREIPATKSSSVNDKMTFDLLDKVKPDLVITQVPEKIEGKVLKKAKIGFINKHASLLPKYRGLLPVFWALLNKEKEIGYTFHLMTEKIDGGDIIYQETIKIKPHDSVFSLYSIIFEKAGEKLVDLIDDFEKNKIKYKKNRPGNYFSAPKASDIEKFRKLGFKYI